MVVDGPVRVTVYNYYKGKYMLMERVDPYPGIKPLGEFTQRGRTFNIYGASKVTGCESESMLVTTAEVRFIPTKKSDS